MSNENLLDRVIALMEKDIKSVEDGEDGIDIATSKKLTDYAKTLVTLNKDNREQMKVGEFEALSDEEFAAQVAEAHAVMNPKDSEDDDDDTSSV